MPPMDRDLAARAVPDPRSAPRRRDRHGRGFRRDLIPAHLPGHRSRRERFDDLVADSVATIAERFPRRLAHLQVMVEEVPPEDPAPWEDAPVVLGRALPATREHPPRVVLYRRPVATRCTGDEELEALVRQVVSEQIGSLLGMAAEDVDPEAWED
ncbi:metallopeptidase family protein [Brachybacterium horti]